MKYFTTIILFFITCSLFAQKKDICKQIAKEHENAINKYESDQFGAAIASFYNHVISKRGQVCKCDCFILKEAYYYSALSRMELEKKKPANKRNFKNAKVEFDQVLISRIGSSEARELDNLALVKQATIEELIKEAQGKTEPTPSPSKPKPISDEGRIAIVEPTVKEEKASKPEKKRVSINEEKTYQHEVVDKEKDKNADKPIEKLIDAVVQPPKQIISVNWLEPNADKLDVNGWIADEPKAEVKIKVISSQKIDQKNCTLHMDGMPQTGKDGEQKLVSTTTGNLFEYTFTQKMRLTKGQRNMYLQVTLPDGTTQKSKSIKVTYNPDPNLYILSIGTDFEDLYFCEKDAKDIATAFGRQSSTLNPIFSNVYIDTLIGKAATAASIEARIAEYKDKNLRPQDVFILFISSHGDTKNSNFYIKGSDFKEDSFLKTTISYGEMVDHLNSFAGKKTIWLDACRSGAGLAAKGAVLTRKQKAISSALHNIIDSQEGIITLTSSKAEENSYECYTCENGVFTHALLKGLRLADKNNDTVIYIDELFDYIQKEMPNIINNEVYKIVPIKKRPTQTPMLRNKIGNIPIFMLN